MIVDTNMNILSTHPINSGLPFSALCGNTLRAFLIKTFPLSLLYHEIENKTLPNFTALNRDFKQTRQLVTEQKITFTNAIILALGDKMMAPTRCRSK